MFKVGEHLSPPLQHTLRKHFFLPPNLVPLDILAQLCVRIFYGIFLFYCIFSVITPMRVKVEFDIYRGHPAELQRGSIADGSGSRVAPKAFKWWFEMSCFKDPLRVFWPLLLCQLVPLCHSIQFELYASTGKMIQAPSRKVLRMWTLAWCLNFKDPLSKI